eukprot:3116510-Pyramimonas_sp.AAC.1
MTALMIIPRFSSSAQPRRRAGLPRARRSRTSYTPAPRERDNEEEKENDETSMRRSGGRRNAPRGSAAGRARAARRARACAPMRARPSGRYEAHSPVQSSDVRRNRSAVVVGNL